ncbi:MAG: type IV pilus modification PilV family protein [Actinomycetota bacterium]
MRKLKKRVGLRLRYQLAKDEQGFTMLEMIVALSVLATSMLILTGTLANSLRPLSLAKERASAVAAAQKYLEIARSIGSSQSGVIQLGNQGTGTYAADSTITNGSDPAIVMSGGIPTFNGEPINLVNVQSNPFSPHVFTVTSTPTTVTVSVYVTVVNATTNLLRVTVRVVFSGSPIPGASNSVNMQTLIIPDRTGSEVASDVPLVGNANVTNGTAVITTAVGNPLPAATTLELTNPVTQVNTSSASRKQVTSSAKQPSISLTGGSSFGGDQKSCIIEDDPMSPSYNAQGYQTNSGTWPSAVLPGDIASLDTLGAGLSTEQCTASVVGSDYLHPGLAYGQASIGPDATQLISSDDTAGLAGLGTVQILSVGAASATSTVSHTPDATTNIATAQQTTADTQVMVINAAGLSLLATNGLLRIESMNSTATAYGLASGTPASPTISSTGQMKIWVYDPSNLLSVAPAGPCTSRSALPDPVGYCIIQKSVSASASVNLSESLPETGATARWTVTLNAPGGATSTSVTASRSVWQSQFAPATATVEFCVTTGSDCSALGKTVDHTVTLDMGSVLAQAIYGL